MFLSGLTTMDGSGLPAVILDLHVLQETDEGETIRYICKCDNDDEWEYSYKTFIFNKRDMRWYMET